VKRRIEFPRAEGTYSKQAHVALPEGTYEREIGRQGFFGPATHMYHRHPPTGWSAIDGPLRPRAFRAAELAPSGRDASLWEAPVLVHNAHVEVRLWRVESPRSELLRNADGDVLLFVHSGSLSLFCDYGHLDLSEGDYLLLPRSTLWRVEPDASSLLLSIEATEASYGLPDRGMLGEHAVFDPAVLETPHIDAAFRAQQHERECTVSVKSRGLLSTLRYPFNPLDAVGWKGNLLPVRLNWRDIRPIASDRYHVPPSAHTTFLSDRFVVCTFCPRRIENDPQALKVPFFHSNDDFDELIFYHSGDFFSRDGIEAGAVTLHPRGLSHGPHPKALARSLTAPRTETDEVAVMIDTRDALEVTAEAAGVEVPNYALSWSDGA